MKTISFLLFRLQESGLGSQDILSEKPWKLFTSEEKGKICFFMLIYPFQAIWSRKNVHKFFFNFF